MISRQNEETNQATAQFPPTFFLVVVTVVLVEELIASPCKSDVRFFSFDRKRFLSLLAHTHACLL